MEKYDRIKKRLFIFAEVICGFDGVQFSHTFDEQIGGQIKAGFLIAGAYEDFNNDTDAISDGIPSFWATKAVKL